MAKTLNSILKWIKDRPVKTALALGLAGLVSVTALKDNVHFGSVELNNPQENHYTWGLLPITTIHGKTNMGFYTFGLVVGVNEVGDSSSAGDMSAYGLISGGNGIGNNSSAGDMSAYGLILGVNSAGNSSSAGDMSTYGLILGVNSAREGARVKNIESRGILAQTSLGNGFGVKSYKNLDEPISKAPKK